MKTLFARPLIVLAATLAAALVPSQAHATVCSLASTAGSWAYAYSGTIFTPAGALPLASVGHFKQDMWGNVIGSQNRSVGGQSGVEDISGTISVNEDCTASATINVAANGQPLRTAALALVYDSSGNHLRAIFQSLALSDGTSIPVVITIDGNRVKSRD